MRNMLTAFAIGGALVATAPAHAVTIAGTSTPGGNTINPVELTGSQISVDFGISAFQPIGVNFTVEAGDAAAYNFDSSVEIFTGVDPLATGIQTLTLALTGGATFGLGTVTPSFSNAVFSLNAASDVLNIRFSPAETNNVVLGSLSDAIGDFTINRNNVGVGSSFGLSVAGAVPEPGTWLMMVAGFGLLGMTLRRRTVRAVAA